MYNCRSLNATGPPPKQEMSHQCATGQDQLEGSPILLGIRPCAELPICPGLHKQGLPRNAPGIFAPICSNLALGIHALPAIFLRESTCCPPPTARNSRLCLTLLRHCPLLRSSSFSSKSMAQTSAACFLSSILSL